MTFGPLVLFFKFRKKRYDDYNIFPYIFSYTHIVVGGKVQRIPATSPSGVSHTLLKLHRAPLRKYAGAIFSNCFLVYDLVFDNGFSQIFSSPEPKAHQVSL